MSFVILLFSSLLMLSAILMVLLVFLQNPKEEGQNVLGSTGVQNLVGVVSAASLIEKITYMLALFIFLFTLFTSYLIKQENRPAQDEHVLENFASRKKPR